MRNILFIILLIWTFGATVLLFAQGYYIYDGKDYFENLGATVIENYDKIFYDGLQIWGEGGIGIDLSYYGNVDYVVKLGYVSAKEVTVYETGLLYTHAVIMYNPSDMKRYLILGSDLEDMAREISGN